MHLIIKTLVLLLSLSHIVTAHSADKPNILVMAEDVSEGTVPHSSRVSKSVVSALQNQMHDRGFNVYDRSIITLDNFDDKQRSDNELLDLARSIKRPPIDVVLVFRIYASSLQLDTGTKISARIDGRMLNALSGKFLGEFNLDSGKPWNAPAQCSRECLAATLNDKASVMANDLGAVLAEKLAWMTHTKQENTQSQHSTNNPMLSDYYLTFDGFSAADMLEIEEYLVIFSGYDSLRPTEQHYTRSELLYRSSSSTAKLNRNLKKMLEELNKRALVNFAGNNFTIKRITFRAREPQQTDNYGW
ncbi:hypothetical protein [Paraglaciecola hydrolytica]|uniref:Uncharacterized protein n=1 Tax=Paraglaciecola hydrolytica TaxID=1799789 RepID=A0A136A000_9ALTE|nr:hypothetical protein [Paraglaciecola hydrolytica]KXI28480.1 hypothetical protein AX660_15420 [Paraglaciecola hydrolytica]